MDKKLLKEEYKRLLTKAIEGRPGGMALMIVLEETDFYNSPASAKHLQWPPCPVLSCRAGLICGRIMDEPASDLIPHEQEYQFDAGRPCKKK